jgi:hypothetical protein
MHRENKKDLPPGVSSINQANLTIHGSQDKVVGDVEIFLSVRKKQCNYSIIAKEAQRTQSFL